MAERPNLLFILSDQHTASVLGCYGDPLVETPHLDGLARRGTLFERAYCAAPFCVPARMSLLTGRFPHENQVWRNGDILHSGYPTHAHALGAAGYRPILVGRMHSIGVDQLRGYTQRLVGDHWPHHPGSGSADYGPLSRASGAHRDSVVLSGSGQSGFQVHDEDVTAAAVGVLDEMGARRRTGTLDHPFALSVGLMLPHSPYVARREDYERYAGRVPPPRHPHPAAGPDGAVHPYVRWWREKNGYPDLAEDDVRRAREAYWALVHRTDAMVGELLGALHRNGFGDDTLVVYTTDHGDMLGEHGLWAKLVLYEDSVRVPLIVSWPGALPQGVRCRRVVSAVDVNATILDACGAPPLPHSRGRSLLPLVASGDPDAQTWDDVAFAEHCLGEVGLPSEGEGRPGEGERRGVYQRMIRQGSWKLIFHDGHPPQLFNLDEDPEERHDRSEDSGCREVREALTRRVLHGWDPAAVARSMAAIDANRPILVEWGRRTQPRNEYLWEMRSDMNWLDGARSQPAAR